MKTIWAYFLSLVLVLSVGVHAETEPRIAASRGTPEEFNPGPDFETEWGEAICRIVAGQPAYGPISEALMEQQKFRYMFGNMLCRIFSFEPNSVKIFFIGQDATHRAELDKKLGTSMFGAVMQLFALYFGVDKGVSTSNAFLSTIRGQYGIAEHPYVYIDPKGNIEYRQMKITENALWLLANGDDSVIRKGREEFWIWMIKNNPESLKLIGMFGQAAEDAFGAFLIGLGLDVGSKYSNEDLKRIRVMESRSASAGGNAEFAVPITKEGGDVYYKLLSDKLGSTSEDFLALVKKDRKTGRPELDSRGEMMLDYSNEKTQEKAVAALRAAGKKGLDLLVFNGGGVNGSGVVHRGQLGGLDLGNVTYKGKKINSLKGIPLPDGSRIEADIGFMSAPHPTAMGFMEQSEGEEAVTKQVRRSFGVLKELRADGWRIEPDLDDNGQPLVNQWDQDPESIEWGDPQKLRPGFFEQGTPDDRIFGRAAVRMGPQVNIANDKDTDQFDPALIQKAKDLKPWDELDPRDIWANHESQEETMRLYDRGPSPELYGKMMRGVDRAALFKPKDGKSWKVDGIDAFNTKTHPNTGLFGPYRGTFDGPRVFTLADPIGLDPWNTSIAFTGERGQYHNGFLRDLGFTEKRLVLQTVPVGMDGATAAEWAEVLPPTENYREVAFAAALKAGKLEIIFTDGPYAKIAMQKLVNKFNVTIPVVNIERAEGDPSFGFATAGKRAAELLPSLKDKTVTSRATDIPRRELTWWARGHEGRGGDSVVDAIGKNRGWVRAVVMPTYAARQKVSVTQAMSESIMAMQQVAESFDARLSKEPVADFLARKGVSGKLNLPDGLKSVKFARTKSVDRGVLDFCAAAATGKVARRKRAS